MYNNMHKKMGIRKTSSALVGVKACMLYLLRAKAIAY